MIDYRCQCHSEALTKYDCMSDFPLRLKFSANGEMTELAPGNFRALFRTVGGDVYVASRRGEQYTNCYEEDGQLIVIFDNHGLRPGRLHVEFHQDIPDSRFPDGFLHVVFRQHLPVELTRHCASLPVPEGVEVDVNVPYIIEVHNDLDTAVKGIFSYDPDTRTLNITTDDSD